MSLAAHFRAHLTSDMVQTRKMVTAAVLADREALRELEEAAELWLDLPAETLSASLTLIFGMRGGRSAAHACAINQQYMRIGHAVERLYMAAINTFIDSEYQSVNAQELVAAENHPEPEYAQ